MNEALPVKGVKVDGATVKDLKEYLANYKDDDPICVIGAYREGELQTRLVDLNFFGVLKPGEYEYPIFLMEIKEYPEEQEKKDRFHEAAMDYTNYCRCIEMERIKSMLLKEKMGK